MMINKRLIGTVRESKKYIAGNVAAQWISLAANIAMMTALISLLASLFTRTADTGSMILTAAAAAMAIAVHFLCAVTASRMSLTSEAVQVAVEGIEAGNVFRRLSAQFFYAMLAPLTLFAYLCFVNVPSAIVLLVCVPLISVAIAAVRPWESLWRRPSTGRDTLVWQDAC